MNLSHQIKNTFNITYLFIQALIAILYKAGVNTAISVVSSNSSNRVGALAYSIYTYRERYRDIDRSPQY